MTEQELFDFEDGYHKIYKTVHLEYGPGWCLAMLDGAFNLPQLLEITEFVRRVQEEGVNG